MRSGVALSAGLHGGVLAIAVLGLPALFAPEPQDEMAIAVTVLAEAAEPETEPEPPEPPEPEPPKPEPPKPEPPPEPPKPEPPPEPPKPEPPPEPPKPEPPPEPKPPPEPEPEPEPPKPEPPPEPPKPEPKPVPRPPEPPPPPQAKPKPPPAQIARAVPTPRRKPKPPPDAFDTLLRDLEQRREAARSSPAAARDRKASAAPAPPPRRQDGLRQRRLIALLVRAIREQVRQCWNPPIGIKDAHKLRVGIRIRLNPDGTLIGRPRVVDKARLARDPVFQAYAESAVRALQNPRCTPLRLPLESYSAWREISFNFDTRELLQ